MHDDAYIGGRSANNINASCVTISGGRTEQLDIFCRVTGFMSDLLSFIVVENIRFFHGAIQLQLRRSCALQPQLEFERSIINMRSRCGVRTAFGYP